MEVRNSAVYITDYVNVPDIEREIGSRYGVEVLTGKLSEHEVQRVTGLLVWHQVIDEAFLNRFPNVKFIVRYGVGYDQIDLYYLKSRGITFANTPDYGTDEVADTALAMILTGCRGISEYQAMIPQLIDGSWQENTIKGLKRIKEQKLGVIGLGRIGTALAIKAKAVGFDVTFYDPYRPSGIDKSLSIQRVSDMKGLLQASDVVSVHAPLNSETEGLIDDEFLSEMKQGAIFVNTARGGILKTVEPLLDYLSCGHLSFAALDVLPTEPPIGEPYYERMLNLIRKGILVINPHTAYYSCESYVEMRSSAARNVCAAVKGATLINQISET